MTTRLYAHVPCAPRSWWLQRGLHRTLLDIPNASGFLDLFFAHAGRFIPGSLPLGLLLHNPWGRGPYTTWPNGLTSMRSDQAIRAYVDGYSWITNALIAAQRVERHDTILYVGGYPDTSIGGTRLHAIADAHGYGLAFDGLSASTHSSLLDSARARDGQQVWIEANPRLPVPQHLEGVPIIAEADRWRHAAKRGQVSLEHAPRPSIWWWRGDRLEFDLSAAEHALSLGHSLCVRLDRLRDDELNRLIEIVQHAEAHA